MATQKIDYKKYEAAVKYILSKLGVVEGRKKLYKLFYYIDFDYFELNNRSITGDIYLKWPMGPVPQQLQAVINDMDCVIQKSKKTQPHHENGTCFYELKSGAVLDFSALTKDEMKMIDRVVAKYGKMSGGQLEALTHSEPPYNAVGDREQIPYEYSYYRDTPDLNE